MTLSSKRLVVLAEESNLDVFEITVGTSRAWTGLALCAKKLQYEFDVLNKEEQGVPRNFYRDWFLYLSWAFCFVNTWVLLTSQLVLRESKGYMFE